MTINPVATGLSHGHPDKVGHVERAVNSALEKAGASHANSVLLFLTSDYAHDPAPAIRAAARAAGCTQVTGATGAGLLTDQEWVIDSSGAAAMVFTGRVRLGLSQQAEPNQLRLCLCTPQAVSNNWLDEPIKRFGAVTSDELGHGPFAVWTSGAVVKDEFTEVTISGASAEVAVARGVQVLTAPLQVDEVKGLDVYRIANHPALHVLISALPEAAQRQKPLPLHMVMCGTTFGEPDTAIEEGRFRLDHIVAADPEQHSVTLSHPLRPGERLFWAMRDSVTAEHTMQESARECRKVLGGVPDFTIMFPCLSRGPLFFGGSDKDLAAARESFPGTPIIGFYGNGEIAPLDEHSHLHQYSTVLAAFRCHDA
jgi:small ligand-binding sensory domain FIST